MHKLGVLQAHHDTCGGTQIASENIFARYRTGPDVKVFKVQFRAAGPSSWRRQTSRWRSGNLMRFGTQTLTQTCQERARKSRISIGDHIPGGDKDINKVVNNAIFYH